MILRSAVLSHPADIESWLRSRGFFADDCIGLVSLPELYGSAFRPDDEATVSSLVALRAGGNYGKFEIEISYYYNHPGDTPAVHAHALDLVDGLFDRVGLTAPRAFLAKALAGSGPRLEETDGVTIEVIFPDPEPDQDFYKVIILLSRPLSREEWETWLSSGTIAEACRQANDDTQELLNLCRHLLREKQHSLADADWQLMFTGDEGDARTATFLSSTAGTLFLATGSDGTHTLSIVHTDGRLETL